MSGVANPSPAPRRSRRGGQQLDPSLQVGEPVVVVLLDASSGALADPRDEGLEVQRVQAERVAQVVVRPEGVEGRPRRDPT